MADGFSNKPYESDIDEYLSIALLAAAKNDAALITAKERASRLRHSNPKLLKILDNDIPSELSIEECKELIDYFVALNALILEEERVCYLRGFLDGIEAKKTFEQS